jgi:DNA gyrase/topoisomerase IV subunit B
MNDEIQTITFEESVQLRPGMYLGSTDSIGIINLISGLIKECIFIYKTDKLFFSIEFGGDGISFQINSDVDASVILQQLSDKHWKDKVYFRILSALAEHLEIVDGTKLSTSGVTINFQLNKAIFKDMSLDYQHLTEELILLALLNRGTEILIKDTTQKHINQNYFNFPNGIFYLYEKN